MYIICSAPTYEVNTFVDPGTAIEKALSTTRGHDKGKKGTKNTEISPSMYSVGAKEIPKTQSPLSSHA